MYIDSSLHVALSAAVLCYVTGWYFDITPPLYLTLCLFCGSVVGYNFIKYAPLADNFILVKGRYLRGMQLFSAFNFIVAAYLLTYFSLNALLCIVVIGGLVFFYVFPLQRLRGNLRNIRGLKVYVVAVVWALATVILPAMEAGLRVDYQLMTEAFRRALFILAITIPFEIRDLELDQPSLYTLPQQFGVRGARLIGYVSLLVFWVLGIWNSPNDNGEVWIKEGVLVIASLLLLGNAGRNQPGYYSSLVVESLPLFWLVLLKVF
ncbi:hypothetical protein D3A96_04100 [Robertkochia marina]|nr:hypothetical protein D3A96_04100 [Robertkochia marina]